MSSPPPGKSQADIDEEEWQREKERLTQRLKEKREKEQREKEQQGGAQAASGNKVPPSSTDAPKKKKLLNGTNIEYRYPSGSVYVGGFKDGKLHGFGKYKYHPSGDLYEGEWVADMKHGQGTYAYDCGDRYTGEWRSGKKHGKGTYSFASGDEYIGSWKEDKIHGYGVFHIARNGNRYEGSWVESYRHGYGVLYCGNGDVYMGNWTKGKEDAKGVLTYANGNIYAGDWKAGAMDGKGILVESGQKHTVEHISGYCIVKIPVDADGAVDPDWNPANTLYLKHLEKMEAEKNKGSEGGGGGGEGGEALTKMKLEKEMWEKKYNDLLTQKGGGGGGGTGEDDENLNFGDIDAVRRRIADLKDQREMQQRRADEAEQRVKQADAKVDEIQFNVKRLEEELAGAKSNAGGAGGDSASKAELDKMQRRVADLERELNARKQPSTTGNRDTNDPLELKAQLELLDGEVRHLRSSREELQKQREQNLDNQRTIMSLEQKNEELLKEITVARQRATHATHEITEDQQRQMNMQADELKELRAEVQDLKVAAATQEQTTKKMKQKLRDAEEKALRASDLEAQLNLLKTNKSSQNAVHEKRSDEIDSLRAKNAELLRRLDEVEGGPANGAAAAAAGAAASAKASQEVSELQQQLEQSKADYKKEKKKHKKASAERDELHGKVAALRLEADRAGRALSAMSGTPTVVLRVRPPVGQESQKSAVAVEGGTVSVQGQTFEGFAATLGADQSAPDALLEDLRPTARAVAGGTNACVLMLGPMNGGKSHFCSVAAKSLLQDVFKAVDEATRQGGSAASFTPSYSATCVEANCDGLFDLNNPGSTGSDLRPMKDAYGTVVLDGSMSTSVQLARDAAVDYIAAVGRRHRQRSHIIYTLHVTLTHKVTEAVLRGKLTIADLAGAGALGDQQDVDAAKYVNKSVVALNQVVNALCTPGQTTVPYRDDQLTTVLSDALGGNCRLAVVCAVGPSSEEAEGSAQAISTASRLAGVANRPLRVFESSDTMRLRQAVASLQSPEAAEPALSEIDALRE